MMEFVLSFPSKMRTMLKSNANSGPTPIKIMLLIVFPRSGLSVLFMSTGQCSVYQNIQYLLRKCSSLLGQIPAHLHCSIWSWLCIDIHLQVNKLKKGDNGHTEYAPDCTGIYTLCLPCCFLFSCWIFLNHERGFILLGSS